MIALIIGLALFGAVGSFGIIPSVSDNQIGIKEKFKSASDSQISNQVAGITNLALNIPKILGPPLGGIILDITDNFKTLVFIDWLQLIITGIFYVILSEPHIAYRSFKKKPTKDEGISVSVI